MEKEYIENCVKKYIEPWLVWLSGLSADLQIERSLV